MPPDSKIVCPFCQARHSLMGTAFQPVPVGISGDFNFYNCPCGALGLTSHAIDGPNWDVRRAKDVISRLIPRVGVADCDVDMNRVTLIDPPMWMLWVKRRPNSTRAR